MDGWFRRADAFLLGRRTYDLMHPYWREVTDPENLVATRLNGLPKHVVSTTTLSDPVWERTSVISHDVVDRVRELKRSGDGELQVHGSWQLAQTLQDANLVDEWRLLVFPVLVGRGKRLFSDHAPASGLRLVESASTPAGVTSLVYAPVAFDAGAFGVEEGREVVV